MVNRIVRFSARATHWSLVQPREELVLPSSTPSTHSGRSASLHDEADPGCRAATRRDATAALARQDAAAGPRGPGVGAFVAGRAVLEWLRGLSSGSARPAPRLGAPLVATIGSNHAE